MSDWYSPDWLQSEYAKILAGSLGGLVRTLSHPKARIKNLLSDVTVGAVLAVYLGPAAGSLLKPVLGVLPGDLDPSQADRMGAFLVGVGGMVVVEIIMSAWQRRKREVQGD